jgi:uncharacterized protein YtpQ (UPF0354 family)
MNVPSIFEEELRIRGVSFSIDGSGRYLLHVNDTKLLVSLENVVRDVMRDGDNGQVGRFVECVLASTSQFDVAIDAGRLYWCLERSDLDETPKFWVPISDQVGRALVHLSADGNLVTWVTPEMLESNQISESEAREHGFANLARALSRGVIETTDIDGVALGYIGSELPFKSSLILAPNLREVAEEILGWPLHSVAPNRDFLYLWASRHEDFSSRVGGTVVREFRESSYPISTELFEISDDGIQALGEFPLPEEE